MDLGTWTRTASDSARMKRLGVGYVIGGALVAGLVFALTTVAAGGADDEASGEPALDVAFASVPDEPEPAAKPEPVAVEPESAAATDAKPTPAIPRVVPRTPRIETPIAVPSGPPPESD